MTVEVYEYDEELDAQSEDTLELSGPELLEYQDEIREALKAQELPEEKDNGKENIM